MTSNRSNRSKLSSKNAQSPKVVQPQPKKEPMSVLAALKKKEEGKADFRKQFQNNMKTKADNMRKQKLLDNGAKELKRLREERANIDVNDAQVQNTKNTYDSKRTSMRTSQDAQEDY